MGLNFTVIAIIGVLLTAAGLFTYHEITVTSLKGQIQELQNQANELQAKNNALAATNESFKAEIQNKNEETAQVQLELQKFRLQDQQTQEQVIELERKLADSQYNTRLESIRKSRKAELLLDFANQNVKCETEHMEDAGRCVMGVFKPAAGSRVQSPVASSQGGQP